MVSLNATSLPANLTERVRDGALSLDPVPLSTLKAWSREASRQVDRDTLGHAIMYRRAAHGV